ncbi:hypothetical protein BDZ97DRAFT_856108 [Flammula alnicola]|nr:hypothetical protein BDZ97DRAFT_856108 [Flammula alnicola]
MVKRPKSPEIVEDARYFTVYQPYPLNANWVLEDDQMQCAMWVAECIGVNHLWAIHEKPKARGMILLEVSKAFTDHGRLLGEHRWSEFLKDPTEEEKPRVTQVFHSFYAKGRDAQKDGWKAITISCKWFKGWAPGKGKIVQPYPDTHWCQTPVGDKTNKTLCRPLPVEQKVPPRVQPPVVGSSTWVAKQVEGPPTKAALVNAWSKKVAPVNTNKANQAGEKTQSGGSTEPAASNKSAAKGGSKGTWGKPASLRNFAREATKPNGSKGKSAWAKPMQSSASTSGAPSPWNEESPAGPVNAWAKSPPSFRAKPSQGVTLPSTGSNSRWGQPSHLEGNSTYAPSNDSWYTEDSYKKDKGKDRAQNTPDSGSGTNSNWSTRPSSPRKARSKPEKARKKEEPPPVSTLPAYEYKETVTPAFDYDNLDFGTPQGGKLEDWGFPPAEPAKNAEGKGKKVDETVENFDFGPPMDWGPPPPEKKSAGKKRTEKTGNDKMDVDKPDPNYGTWGSWGAEPAESKNKAAGKKRKDPDTFEDYGAAQGSMGDWGATPPPEPENKVDETTDTFDYDNLNFGAPKGNLADWGFPPAPAEEKTDADMDESEFNPWEKKEAPVDLSAWGPLPTTEDLGEQIDWETLFNSDTGRKKKKVLICPTHNIACKKGICRDMARLVGEEEWKAKNGITDSEGQGQ